MAKIIKRKKRTKNFGKNKKWQKKKRKLDNKK